VKFIATKEYKDNNFFPFLFFIVVELGIRDPRWKRIRIWDPGHTSRIRKSAGNIE
jgi:hypothetical protein